MAYFEALEESGEGGQLLLQTYMELYEDGTLKEWAEEEEQQDS